MSTQMHVVLYSPRSLQVQFGKFLGKILRPLAMQQRNARFVGVALVAPSEPEALKSTSSGKCTGKLNVQAYVSVEASVLRRQSDTM
jgi:hypothetical protein